MKCCCLFYKDNNNLNLNNNIEPFFTFSEIKKEFVENKEISGLSTKKTYPFKLKKNNNKPNYKSFIQFLNQPNIKIDTINTSNFQKNKKEHSIVENLKFSYYDENENKEEFLDTFNSKNIPQIQKNNIKNTNINTNINTNCSTEQTTKQNKINEEINKNFNENNNENNDEYNESKYDNNKINNNEDKDENTISSSSFSEQENESIKSLTELNNNIFKKTNTINNNFFTNINSFNNNIINNLNNKNLNLSPKNDDNKNIESNSKKSSNKLIQFTNSNTQKNEGKKLSFNNLKSFSNPFVNRRSSVMIYGKNEFGQKQSLKRNSIMQLFEKQSGLNEFRIVESISKNHHFLTRIKLIENTFIKNKRINLIETCHLNEEGKGKINLYLQNVVGKLLLENLTINPLGLIDHSRRNQKDTLTFFGYSDQKNYNDYVLNNTSFIYNNKTFSKTLFAFSYDINNEKYFIQPILDKEKQGRLIYIGISNFNYNFINTKVFLLNKNLIQIIPSSNNKIFHVTIKIFDNNTGKSNEFNVNNITKDKSITIGYSGDNYISLKGEGGINDGCVLNFDKEKEIWSIKGKKLWSVLDQKLAINGNLYIKIGDEIIKVSLV